MPLVVRDLPNLFVNTTSTTATNAVGHLDDATSITIFLASTGTTLSSGDVIQVSQFDPADKFPYGSDWNAGPTGIVQSSQFYNLSSSNVYTSGSAFTINNISFRGLRISLLASANSTGDVIAWVSKQITVVMPFVLAPLAAAALHLI